MAVNMDKAESVPAFLKKLRRLFAGTGNCFYKCTELPRKHWATGILPV
jgi:hypothetical protein